MNNDFTLHRPLPPPRRKKKNGIDSKDQESPIFRSRNLIRHKITKLLSYSFVDQCMDEDPESIVGPGVDICGELCFDRLLRIDGSFTGKLASTGNLIIGPKGRLFGDVENMNHLLIDGGELHGNVLVERLTMINRAVIKGFIACKSLEVEDACTIVGSVNVHSLSPEVIDEDGDIVNITVESGEVIRSCSCNSYIHAINFD